MASSVAPRSLTGRLLWGALLWVLCSLIIAAGLLYTLFKQHLEQQLHKELQLHTVQLITQLSLNPEQQGLILSDPRFEQPLSGLYWQIDRLTATVPLSWYSRSLWDEGLQPPKAQQGSEAWFRYKDPVLGELYVVGRQITLAETETEASYQLWVAAQADVLAEPLQRFMMMLALALAALGAVLVIGVWWQLRLGLRPLHVLRQRLSAVHEGTAETIDGSYPQEIQPLVSDFNQVLQSHAQLVARARTEASNWSHAIKTPLAVVANAAKSQDPQLATIVLEQVALAQRQIDYHLSRARVVTVTKPVGGRTEVVPAFKSLVKLLQQVYAAKQVHVKWDIQVTTAIFRGEASDLHELLGNVLDNAFKWCKQFVRIQVEASQTTKALTILIEDDGDGIGNEQLTTVFTRGVRLDEQVPGSGVGLAITADLVQLYGGTIQLSASDLGGLAVRIYLP